MSFAFFHRERVRECYSVVVGGLTSRVYFQLMKCIICNVLLLLHFM